MLYYVFPLPPFNHVCSGLWRSTEKVSLGRKGGVGFGGEVIGGQKLWQNFNIVQLNYSLADKTISHKKHGTVVYLDHESEIRRVVGYPRTIEEGWKDGGGRNEGLEVERPAPRTKWVICTLQRK